MKDVCQKWTVWRLDPTPIFYDSHCLSAIFRIPFTWQCKTIH